LHQTGLPWMEQSTVSGDKMNFGFLISDFGFLKSQIANKGFTLIELLIVMSIIAILATIAQPSFKQAIIKARESVLKEDLFILRDVIDQYYADKGKYPPAMDDLVGEGYIRGIPRDPFTNSTDTWQFIYNSEQEEEQGIYDVHSGSDMVAVDGTAYNEW